jgi:hypothetical protein
MYRRHADGQSVCADSEEHGLGQRDLTRIPDQNHQPQSRYRKRCGLRKQQGIQIVEGVESGHEKQHDYHKNH